MKRIEPWKAIVFVISLGAIATGINHIFDVAAIPEPQLRRIQVPQIISQKSPEESAAERAKTEHATLLAKYREPGFSREPGKRMVAILVGTDEGKMDRGVATALAQKLRAPEVKIATSVFTPQFFADGLLSQAIDDAPAVAQRLELTDSLDSIVVGRESIGYSADSSLENLVTATIRLEVTIFALRNQDSQSITFTANGAGFKQVEARQMAEERLAKQISRESKLALNL